MSQSSPDDAAAPHVEALSVTGELSAYWHERRQYLTDLSGLPEMRRRYAKAMMVYLLRRVLWAFLFFPVFLAFWVPLILARFNPVVLVQEALPYLQSFTEANPQQQAQNLEMLLIGWLTVGVTYAIFDMILTPFNSPYEYEADVHMRAWMEIRRRLGPETPQGLSD